MSIKSEAKSPFTKIPACYGHRGASHDFPENTIASFRQAIKDGSEGLESDVHISKDGVILMLHDASLDRVTNGTGIIEEQPYRNGIDQLRTLKTPAQPIATFDQTLELLNEPQCNHVKLILDLKPDNDPELLFTLIQKSLTAIPDWQNNLAPRVVLGLWHPKFIEPAKRLLPECKRIHIAFTHTLAEPYFWAHCEGFLIHFTTLYSSAGQAFRERCRRDGKELYTWTVNGRSEMIEATKWGLDAILTDKPADLLKLRGDIKDDWVAVSKEPAPSLLSFSSIASWSVPNKVLSAFFLRRLAHRAGPLPNPE